MGASWDDYAAGWDTNPDVIHYANSAFESLCQLVSLNGLRVLDFGCGTGLLTERIAELAATVVAIDPSAKMVDVLAQKNIANVSSVVGEVNPSFIRDNPCFANGFDLIVASSVCGFLTDYERTLLDLKGLLKPGGIFVQWDWQRTDDDGSGFEPAEILQAYADAGLSSLGVSEAFSLGGQSGTMAVLMGVAKNLS